MWLRVLGFGLLLGLAGCGSEPKSDTDLKTYERVVDKETFDGKWPFAFDSGVIGCVDEAAYISNGNDTYALTGFSQAYSKNRGYNWIAVTPENPIWLADPDYPEARVSVSEIIGAAREFCED